MRSTIRLGLLVSGLLASACANEDTSSDVTSDDVTQSALKGDGGIEATLSITAVRFGGYCARVTVKNGSSASTSSWSSTLDLRGGRVLTASNATVSSGATGSVFASTSANQTMAAGSSTQYAFCASGSYRTPATITAVSAVYQTNHGTGGSSAGGSSATGGSSAISSSSAGGGIAQGGSAAGGSTPTTTPGGGPAPVLPAITGTCPTFTTGTTTVGGLGGISLQVGAKKQGTGSLLFYWHGTGSSSSEVNSLVPSSVRQDILNQGGIIVAFQSSVGTGGDCSGTSTFSKDDFKIADLIAACAVRDHGIDPRRIYTTGCSAGGLQAGCMGAMRSSYIAATVPNSGGEVMRQTIQDTKHVPAVMTMHGGSSDVVGVSFAQTSATYDAHMSSAGSFVVNCNHGGGHCRAPAALYTAAWEFMKAHPFGVAPEPYASAIPSSFPSYCAEY